MWPPPQSNEVVKIILADFEILEFFEGDIKTLWIDLQIGKLVSNLVKL